MQAEREELVGRERVALMYWEVQLDLTPEIEVLYSIFCLRDVILKIERGL